MLGRSGAGCLLVIAAVAGMALLPGCSTVGSLGGVKKEGATNDSAARYVTPDDPMARPVQVAWTSARASNCGFMFDPAKLKDDYMRDEGRRITDPYQLQRISQAYDYTLSSMAATIKSDPNYCTRDRTDAIRADLRRYLAGDYSPTAKLAR
ncbi:hypothetical protein [Methyloceanibacter sp.]|uniref:hypothetical protein n=1 Tax=Methyloceanibacter sp. TaxID=1965321 RepID=UPI003D6D664F